MYLYYKIKIEDYPIAYGTTAVYQYPWFGFKKEGRLPFKMKLEKWDYGIDKHFIVWVPMPDEVAYAGKMIKVPSVPYLEVGQSAKITFSMIDAVVDEKGLFEYKGNYDSILEITYMDLKSMIQEIMHSPEGSYILMQTFKSSIIDSDFDNCKATLNYEEMMFLIGDLDSGRKLNKFYLSLLKEEGEFKGHQDEARKYIIQNFDNDDLRELIKEGYFPPVPTDSYLGEYRFNYCLANSIRINNSRYILVDPHKEECNFRYLDLYKKMLYLHYPDHNSAVRRFFELYTLIFDKKEIEWKQGRYDNYYAEYRPGNNYDNQLKEYLLGELDDNNPFVLFLVSYFELTCYENDEKTFFTEEERKGYFDRFKDYADSSNDYMALYGLARCYATGRAFEKNNDKALNYYKKADEAAPFDVEKVFGYTLFED